MEWNQPSQGHHDAFIWFRKFQLQAVFRNGVAPDWFHGIISRKKAEELLHSKPHGCFLIRVSESRIGYSLSCCDKDFCRHFMIDVLEDGQCIVVGENRNHGCLQDLVEFYRRNPVLNYDLRLTVACGQVSAEKTDYEELLFPSRCLTSDNNLPQISFPHPTTIQSVSEPDIPPQLPHRPSNLLDPVVMSPNNQPRLYPCLSMFGQISSPSPAVAPPLTRRMHKDENLLPDQPPELPPRRCVPQQNLECVGIDSTPRIDHRSVTSEQNFCSSVGPVKGQQVKTSAVANLKNFKKKIQKKAISIEENSYSEIDLKAVERGDTENENPQTAGELPSSAPPYNDDKNPSDKILPLEYLPPPPFAPGY